MGMFTGKGGKDDKDKKDDKAAGKDDPSQGHPNKTDDNKGPLEAKLTAAVQAVEALMEDNPTLEGAGAQIEEIRAKFELKRLEAKLTSPSEVSIDAEINPKRHAKEKFKKSQIAKIRDSRQRQRACEQAGYHGEEIESHGGSPQRAETKNATALKRHQAKLDKLNAIKTGLEVDVAALEKVLAELQTAPPAPGAPSKENIEDDLATARERLAQCKDRIGGVVNSITGINHEDHATEQLKPDQRNVEVICALCKGVVTDFDLVKRTGNKTTVFEAKASSSAVKADQIRKQIAAAKALYGEAAQVMLALPTLTQRDRQILEEKFAKAKMPVPDIAEIAPE